jgi:hypothetical protein
MLCLQPLKHLARHVWHLYREFKFISHLIIEPEGLEAAISKFDAA